MLFSSSNISISAFMNLQTHRGKYSVLSECQGYPDLLQCTSEIEHQQTEAYYSDHRFPTDSKYYFMEVHI